MQGASQQIQAGKLHALAVTNTERSRNLPQVPTVAELGYRDLSLQIWFELVIPAATPQNVIGTITTAVFNVQSYPEHRAKLEAQGFEVPREYGVTFARTITSDTARGAKVIQATGFKATD